MAADTPTPALTPAQLHALFDILTHHETYSEIESFKHPTAIRTYGYPFPSSISEDGTPTYAVPSTSPILQLLFSSVVLPLPPLQDLVPEFWRERAPGVLAKFAEAELSESYDKGALGTRKTLSTACSALLEGIGRGVLGGIPGGEVEGGLAGRKYEETAEGLEEAWDDGLREVVYGELVGELFGFAVEREDFESHSECVKVAVEYVVIHIASFLHALLVSPDGPYLLKLLENLHKLIPYVMIKQTLRVGNAATMINGMVRLLLAKIGVGSALNWIGITKDAEDGMNLLQRICSMILSWDSSDFQKILDRVEKAKDGPSAAHLGAIKKHVAAPRSDHDAVRATSAERQQSIIIAVLESTDSDLAKDLSDAHHAQCLEYYSALLSVRDRDEITKVLCHQSPDLLTQAIKDAVAAFDSVIRRLHTGVDLKEHLGDLQTFIGEFIEVGKGHQTGLSPTTSPVTVKDLVELLHKHKPMLWKFLHRVAKDCPEIRDEFKGWAQGAVKNFRNTTLNETHTNSTTATNSKDTAPFSKATAMSRAGAGAMNAQLSSAFSNLPTETRAIILRTLDSHAAYLTTMSELTTTRLRGVIDQIHGKGDSPAPSATGPGLYLARWQSLMDETKISPATASGPVRRGADVRNATTQGKVGATVAVTDRSGWFRGRKSRTSSPAPGSKASTRPSTADGNKDQDEKGKVQPPDARAVVDALGGTFRDLLAERSKAVQPDSKT